MIRWPPLRPLRPGAGRLASAVGRCPGTRNSPLPGFPRLDCEFSGAYTGVMSLRTDFATQRDSGVADFGARRWQVRSVNNLQAQKGSFPLARFGYEFVLDS